MSIKQSARDPWFMKPTLRIRSNGTCVVFYGLSMLFQICIFTYYIMSVCIFYVSSMVRPCVWNIDWLIDWLKESFNIFNVYWHYNVYKVTNKVQTVDVYSREDAMRKAGTPHSKSSNDMENHVYVKAKSRVSNAILHELLFHSKRYTRMKK